jgi:hypothetical protein
MLNGEAWSRRERMERFAEVAAFEQTIGRYAEIGVTDMGK